MAAAAIARAYAHGARPNLGRSTVSQVLYRHDPGQGLEMEMPHEFTRPLTQHRPGRVSAMRRWEARSSQRSTIDSENTTAGVASRFYLHADTGRCPDRRDSAMPRSP